VAVVTLVVGSAGAGLVSPPPERPSKGARRVAGRVEQVAKQPADLGHAERGQHANGRHDHRPRVGADADDDLASHRGRGVRRSLTAVLVQIAGPGLGKNTMTKRFRWSGGMWWARQGLNL